MAIMGVMLCLGFTKIGDFRASWTREPIVEAGELTRTFFLKLEHVDTLTVNVMSR